MEARECVCIIKGGRAGWGRWTCLSWWLGGSGKKVEELDAGIGLEGRRRKGWNGVKEGGSGAHLVRCTRCAAHRTPNIANHGTMAPFGTTAQLHAAVCRHVAICSATLASFLDNDHQRA